MNQLVFLGDSVTDCSRKRSDRWQSEESSLGNGWVRFVAQALQVKFPIDSVWNRGVSGALTQDILKNDASWPLQESGEPVKSQLATLMIGINDVWHPFWKAQPHNVAGALNAFEKLLEQISRWSDHVLVMEPVALPIGEVKADWWPVLDALSKGQATLCMANNSVHWLALQDSLMQDAQGKFSDYLDDGVHPTALGHRWISKQWLRYVAENSLL